MVHRVQRTSELTRVCSEAVCAADVHPPRAINPTTHTLKRGGSARSSLTRMHRPMSVAMEQCGIVGVKRISTAARRAVADQQRVPGRKRAHVSAHASSSRACGRPHRTLRPRVVDSHALKRRDLELLQRQRVLRVVQVTDELCGTRTCTRRVSARRVIRTYPVRRKLNACSASARMRAIVATTSARSTHQTPRARRWAPSLRRCRARQRGHCGGGLSTRTLSGWS